MRAGGGWNDDSLEQTETNRRGNAARSRGVLWGRSRQALTRSQQRQEINFAVTRLRFIEPSDELVSGAARVTFDLSSTRPGAALFRGPCDETSPCVVIRRPFSWRGNLCPNQILRQSARGRVEPRLPTPRRPPLRSAWCTSSEVLPSSPFASPSSRFRRCSWPRALPVGGGFADRLRSLETARRSAHRPPVTRCRGRRRLPAADRQRRCHPG